MIDEDELLRTKQAPRPVGAPKGSKNAALYEKERNTQITIRINDSDLETIDRMAALKIVSRNTFIVDAVCAAAKRAAARNKK